MVTGIDIVQSQILIAEGYSLDSDEIGIKGQESIEVRAMLYNVELLQKIH